MPTIIDNENFAAWAARPEVRESAMAYIREHVPDADKHIHTLETSGQVIGRAMNFSIINGMNNLYWPCQDFINQRVGERGQYNGLSMAKEPDWRSVFPIFAWAIGFRPQGELAPPAGCPKLESVLSE